MRNSSSYQDFLFLRELSTRDISSHGEESFYQAHAAQTAARKGLSLLKEQESGTKDLLVSLVTMIESGNPAEALQKLKGEIARREPTRTSGIPLESSRPATGVAPESFSKVKHEERRR